ncbi:MAG: hypothetical protein RIQ60_2466 [Pseudomonadota bacterium]|jgi:formylglycine-generating enzyme required for sulfatase activity
MSGIFISYRRLDTKAEARAIFERLRRDLPGERVFIDIEGIDIGVDFSQVIDAQLQQCRVALVLIGAHWLSERDAQGRRRIDDENDFVRIELRAVLGRDIRVVPVLVGGAGLPLSADLPEDIRPLLRRNKFDIDLDTFDTDMKELVSRLRLLLQPVASEPAPIAASEPDPLPARTAARRAASASTQPSPVQGPAPTVASASSSTEASAPEQNGVPASEPAAAPAPVDRARKAARSRVVHRPDEPGVPLPAPVAESRWSAALGKVGSAIGVLAFLGYQITWGPMKNWFSSPTPSANSGVVLKQPAPAVQAGAVVRESVAVGPAPRMGASVAIGTAVVVAPSAGKGTLTRFRDCESDACPWMVALPAGSFMMGSPATEPERSNDEGPQHRVQIKAFAVGQYEVTFAQWDACVAAGGCSRKPEDQGWGRGQRPVINVSWNDAQQYVRWLSARTGKTYRLLSEAEWEYAARAGTTTPFAFGDRINTDQANFDGNGTFNGSAKGGYRQKTVPVGSLAANAWQLHDMHGNVWEWVQDCWHLDYNGAPADGAAWASGCSGDHRVLRGGA